jgi:hypothetical protein
MVVIGLEISRICRSRFENCSTVVVRLFDSVIGYSRNDLTRTGLARNDRSRNGASTSSLYSDFVLVSDGRIRSLSEE